MQSKKRVLAPSYTKDQPERCKRAASLILRKTSPKHGPKIIIMDDETYVYADPDENPSTSHYKFVRGESVPDSARFKKRNNFAEKFMVWQAMSQNGIASPSLHF